MNLIYKCRNCGEQKIVSVTDSYYMNDPITLMKDLIESSDIFTSHACVDTNPPTVGIADLIAVKPV